MSPVTVSQVDALRAELAQRTRPRAVVMTMGALHAGHAELVRTARGVVGPTGTVVVTVFVNPTQFAAGEDLDRYPRTADADLVVAREAGADVLFAPTASEVYGPTGTFREDIVTVDPGPLGDRLEGAARPGHFRGVLTVVTKLLGFTAPDLAVFGEKDYQQLALIRRLVADLGLGVRVLGVPTVRDADGLALSSRNRYLSPAERQTALALPQALTAVARELAAGAAVDVAVSRGRSSLAHRPGLDVDYLVVTGPDLSAPAVHGPARVLGAVRIGATRLIDNVGVDRP